MGVTGLWTVLHPVARPIKVETLAQKRLAIDASIWIYQFLKAVRDKEGNALRNSHVVGFFRRICKLLFLGIKPVFVFDGGAPALKRQTITSRKRRREGKRDDAVRTAGKLLAVQMQRRAEEDEKRRQEEATRGPVRQEEEIPDNVIYAEEVQMADKERQQGRKFKKKDAYHLPDLDVSMAEMGQPNDPRIMSLEDLENYARQFDAGEDINVYDFSKIDFDSPFFMSLPASDRYNILNAARLRSRLRMGYSKDQLDTMFPDRMAFSRFQIERVAERNNLTQRLMNINGMGDDLSFGINGSSRISGEKNREYVLVKNDGVEGGWALGVVSNSKDLGKREKPIDVEELDRRTEESDQEDWDEDEFEDVPIEGLNRLPKLTPQAAGQSADVISKNVQRRRALYKARRGPVPRRRRGGNIQREDAESLFVAEASEPEEEWEDVGVQPALDDARNGEVVEEDDELQKAIALSLESNGMIREEDTNDNGVEREDDDDYREVFRQKRVNETNPFSRGSGKSIAHAANARAFKSAPKGSVRNDSDDEELDLQAALAKSRKANPVSRLPETPSDASVAAKSAVVKPTRNELTKDNPFGGPLPFESLDLGSSLLGKKKMKQLKEDASGGFERPDLEKKEAKALPPWFVGKLEDDIAAAKKQEQEDREKEKEEEERLRQEEEAQFEFAPQDRLRRNDTLEVIDVDEEIPKKPEFIDLVEPESSTAPMTIELQDDTIGNQSGTQNGLIVEDTELRMGDLADKIQVEPPRNDSSKETGAEEQVSDQHRNGQQQVIENADAEDQDEEAPLEWEDSDHEMPTSKHTKSAAQPAGGPLKPSLDQAMQEDGDEEDDFEDVDIELPPPLQPPQADSIETPIIETPIIETSLSAPIPASGLATQEYPLDEVDNADAGEEDPYSDPEDEELFRQLMAEETEHARFASSLNHRTVEQNIRDYEQELKQLRNQQKNERRDADEVTHAMVTECQQLLGLFGLPYITAPMEAEAQCAELVRLGLVDGIVTDDSDCFLFGGTRVYKNMFNQAKFVECYLNTDLEAEFGLTRKRLIAIAQLLGSDYTEGLPGVGPVSAVELVGEFDDLNDFKKWWDQVQTGTLAKSSDAGSKFKIKFRKSQGTKLFLPPSFPDPRVEAAYLEPEVDSDPQPFQWGVPDLNALRSFLMSTIGWGPERTDEILVPVIKDMNTRQTEGTQRNITSFFSGGVGAGAFAPRRREEAGSRRLEDALAKIGQRNRGAASRVEANDDAAHNPHNGNVEEITAEPDKNDTGKPPTKKRKGKKRAKEPSPAPMEGGNSADGESTDGSSYTAPKSKKARRTAKSVKS